MHPILSLSPAVDTSKANPPTAVTPETASSTRGLVGPEQDAQSADFAAVFSEKTSVPEEGQLGRISTPQAAEAEDGQETAGVSKEGPKDEVVEDKSKAQLIDATASDEALPPAFSATKTASDAQKPSRAGTVQVAKKMLDGSLPPVTKNGHAAPASNAAKNAEDPAAALTQKTMPENRPIHPWIGTPPHGPLAYGTPPPPSAASAEPTKPRLIQSQASPPTASNRQTVPDSVQFPISAPDGSQLAPTPSDGPRFAVPQHHSAVPQAVQSNRSERALTLEGAFLTGSPTEPKMAGQSGPQTAQAVIPQALPAAISPLVIAKEPTALSLQGGELEPVSHIRTDQPATGSSFHSNSILQRMEFPQLVSRQIADALLHMPGRPVEITLSPEELGHVRLAVSSSEAGIIVSVLAERPETTDLLRRHIGNLEAAFQDLGYEEIAFSFSDNGAQQRDADTEGSDMLRSSEPEFAREDQSTPVQITLASGPLTGIDIRL